MRAGHIVFGNTGAQQRRSHDVEHRVIASVDGRVTVTVRQSEPRTLESAFAFTHQGMPEQCDRHITIPSRSRLLRKPGFGNLSGCNQSSMAMVTGWILIPVSRYTYQASPASVISVCPSLPRSCNISARSASLSGLCSPRAREPNRIARSSRMSAGIRARKSRTALSVSGSRNFIRHFGRTGGCTAIIQIFAVAQESRRRATIQAPFFTHIINKLRYLLYLNSDLTLSATTSS
jgi:hypothetical protein